MALRFLLDEDMSERVGAGLRAQDVDAVSLHEIDRANRQIPDEEQLAFAAEQGRVLVTYTTVPTTRRSTPRGASRAGSTPVSSGAPSEPCPVARSAT